jgi:hypothetical protein
MDIIDWLIAIFGSLFIISGTGLRLYYDHVGYKKPTKLNAKRHKQLTWVLIVWLLLALAFVIGVIISEYIDVR